MSRLVYIAICALGLQFCSGCIIPYAYPKVAYTPALAVDAPQDEVRVFRVDYTSHDADLSAFDPRLGMQRFTEVRIGSSGTIPAQHAVSAEYGAAILGGALNYFVKTSHTVSVRAYRRGYELNEVHSWGRGRALEWKPAPELVDQERALDCLFPVDRIYSVCDNPEHRAAMAFGAAEYDRLAAAVGEEDSVSRPRLLNKGDILRARAAAESETEARSGAP